MIRTESETRQSFSSSTKGNFISKTSTCWSANGDFISSLNKPGVHNVTINNHGGGNTTLANNGDSTVTMSSKVGDGENIKIAVPQNPPKLCDDGIRVVPMAPKRKKKHKPHLYFGIALAICAIIIGLLLFLWLSDIVNDPTTSTPGALGMTQSISSEPSSTPVTRHPTTPTTKQHFSPIPGQYVEMNHLQDMTLITDKTTKVVIRSTNSTQADLDMFQVHKQPHGVITVQVGHNFSNASDFTHLRQVLEWLSPAVHKLTIDGKISQGCRNNSSSDSRDKDSLPFPSMTLLEIRNFDQCFISTWLKDFWVPYLKLARIHLENGDPYYREQAIKIIRSSNLDAEIDFDQD